MSSESTTRGGFFAIDSRAWAWVCQSGMNSAVVYLVLARGTSPENLTTSWSTNAVEKYTRISRHRARDAIEGLQTIGAVKQCREGTRPSYLLTPAHEVAGCDPRQPLDEWEKSILEEVKRGKRIPGRSDRRVARCVVEKGWLIEPTFEEFSPAPEPKTEPDWIWLPNELVTGAEGEIASVELLRQTQDVMMLRLLVDFYGAQNLREDGGIGRQFTSQAYERFKVGQQGQYTVWGFRSPKSTVIWYGPTLCHRKELTAKEKAAGASTGTDYFRRLDQLVRLGLIQWVPHLFESSGKDA